MGGFRLVSYGAEKAARCGVVVGGQVFDIAAVPGANGYSTALDVLNDWARAKPALDAFAKSPGRQDGRPLASVALQAPVLYPGTTYCAGSNYKDHVNEMSKVGGREPSPDPHELGLKPWHFIKAARAIVGPGIRVAVPAATQKLDWEGEFTAIIGKQAKNVPIEKALDYVAGYTISCDLSCRDLSHRVGLPNTSAFHYDWIGQKCFDGSCPTGPWLVPADDVGDPQKLSIKLWVNDVIKQDSNTDFQIFTLAEQIAQLSARITLYPGDMVLTGSPSGVGHGRGEYLHPGDRVKIAIEKLGTLEFALV